MNYLNRLLTKLLGLSLKVENPDLNLKHFYCDEIHLYKKQTSVFHLVKLKIDLKVSLTLRMVANFQFESLHWGPSIVDNGSGMFFSNANEFACNAEGYNHDEPIEMGFSAYWGKKKELTHSLFKLELSSLTFSPRREIRKDTFMSLTAPFYCHLQASIPKDYWKKRKFANLQWNGSLLAHTFTFDIAEFPRVLMLTEKKEGEEGIFEFTSRLKEGVSGYLTIKEDQEYIIDGVLKTKQPLLSRYLEKYHEIHDLQESVDLSVVLKTQGKTVRQLLRNGTIDGSFQVYPLQWNKLRYESFGGYLMLDRHSLKIHLPSFSFNKGKAQMDYRYHFDQEWELTIQIEKSEIWPFFEIFNLQYGVRGMSTGKFSYGKNLKEGQTNIRCDIHTKEGELVGKKDIIRIFMPFKELKEVQKELLEIEGFKQLVFKLDTGKQGFQIDQVLLQWYLKQKLQLSGNIRRNGKMNLVLEASLINLPLMIFTMKGHYSRPLILPSPFKMAGRFVQESQAVAKGILGKFLK